MVEWKNIGDISLKLFAGGTPSTNHDEYYDGDIPWIRSGEIDFNVINKAERNITEVGYKNSSAKMIRKNSVVMAMTGATVAKSAIVAIDTSANQSVCAIETDEDIANFKFVYYCLANNYFKIKASAQGALTSLNLSMIKQIEIPIPSISEQNRIVGILDTFTASIDNLKEQIAQRRKQYEYYRDQLLDLEGKEGVEMKTLGETCIIKNGYTPSTKEPSFWENGTLPWFTLEDIRKNGRILKDAIKHITSLGVKRGGLFPKDSIIISTTATIGEYALIKSDFLCNQQITCLTIKEEMKGHLLPKYLYYLSDGIGKWCKSHVNGGGSLLIVSTSKLIGLQVPLPTLLEQQRIVSILDTFEASIANLEAQLSQREKQCEYYRNKLLTFE